MNGLNPLQDYLRTHFHRTRVAWQVARWLPGAIGRAVVTAMVSTVALYAAWGFLTGFVTGR